ncbi:hypothetical protein ASPVEDRAFT_83298 [Aspergillus versicolor CBS 583.65]|uniref:Alpha/beta hydrolase fold-3 domain-containing protein n=1 Tax=Aspergillus versicolor CBS 583.65 TaxID=1036611 RepID=A0A1L9PJQ9_ASPVE|nr:uncharacterized protein ASPVEDRAFT_83298 [Aspergillus versicolor CBS 583.65]OJJ01770.1 hypothetical protein ASPVEDRAFT_83298 [Aspergillus versicolor CBS 583.65]
MARLSGTGDLFDKSLYVSTPGLGEGHVQVSVCVPNGPSASDGPKPLVLVMEGGGFVLGQPNDGEHVVRSLSDTVDAVVVSVNYAKSPRYAYPHALLQLQAVLKWALSPEASEAIGIAIDPSRVATMGNSAGGNLATALSLLLSITSGPCDKFRKDLHGEFRLVGQVLLYPSTACNIPYQVRFNACASEVQAKSLPIWAAGLMEASYLPPYVDRDSIFCAPLNASVAFLKSLRSVPPALIITAGMDCLKVEAREYAAKLRQAGIVVAEYEYPDAVHGFSHYKEGSKGYHREDVEGCWDHVTQFLKDRFRLVR